MLSNLRIPSKEELEYQRALQEKRIAAARKADRKAYDAFRKAQYERLFPARG